MEGLNGQVAEQSDEKIVLITDDTSSLTLQDSVAIDGPLASVTAQNAVTFDTIPSHRSHNPQNNAKKSVPFQFGSRFLKEDDNVFEFNAWDNCTTSQEYNEYAELQYSKQREAPVSDFDKSEYLLFPWSPPLVVFSSAS